MSSYPSFDALRTAAVQAFVRTAILIDNEPRGEAAAELPREAPKTATSAAFGAGASQHKHPEPAQPSAAQPTVMAEPTGSGAHHLQVRPVTNAFAGQKITCGFYFPANDELNVVDTALQAARNVDATIVDWHLKTDDTGPAKELIAKLLTDDRAARGRLRLIVVYTGERGLNQECANLKAHLDGAGLTDFTLIDEGRALKSTHALITFANKPARGDRGLEVPGPAARPIPWAELPAFVLSSYRQLSEGLLQSFALKSIGAVRDDTPHLLSVFSSELDGAYLAQRAGIGTPSDAEEMMTELLVAEFATSISDRGIESEILDGEAAALAVVARPQPQELKVNKYQKEPIYENVVKSPQGGGHHLVADKASLQSLVKSGLNAEILKLDHRKDLDKQFFATDVDAKRLLGRFARLTTYAREVDPSRRLGRENLTLRGGMILRSAPPPGGGAERYLLCVQPGCDSVRLTENIVTFPFCPMGENGQKFDLICGASGADKTFKVDRRPSALELWPFAPDANTQTVVSIKRSGALGFLSTKEDTFWEFVAELRALEGQHFTTLLVGKFNRVALNGSEWLRLHRGTGNA